MALVTEPIALDKSLNTTEQASRNIADVLAEELSAIITAIGGLNFINFKVVAELPTTGISTTTIYLVPSDDPQSGNTYDEYINLNGTISGWEKIGSTDIDLSGYYTSAEVDALLADKADVSDIPVVNDGTLTIQQNGETKGTFTANQSGNSIVNIEIPTTDIQTAVDEFETYNGGILSSLKVSLTPNQDLHGYDHPWVGGAGKNQYDENSVQSNVQTLTYTLNNHVFNINGSGVRPTLAYSIPTDSLLGKTHSDNISVTLSGYIESSSNITNFFFGIIVKNTNTGTIRYPSTRDVAVGYKTVTATLSPEEIITRVDINLNDSSDAQSNLALTIKNVQLELGSTATDFAPYSNICPISGHTQSKVGVDGKNLCPLPSIQGLWLLENGEYSNRPTWCCTEKFSIKPNTAYVVSATRETRNVGCVFWDANGGYIGFVNNTVYGEVSLTFTTPTNCRTIAICIADKVNGAGITPSDVTDLQLELGSTATAYVPYNGYQVTVNLGGTYYSGTLDVVSGKLTVDKAFVKGNGLTWLKHSTTFNNVYYSNELQSIIKRPSDNYTIGDIVCSDYVAKAWENVFDANQVGVVISTSGLLGVANPNITTLEDFQTAIADTDICYGLSTPTPIQLSPTTVKALVGENHLSAPLEGQEITESKYKQMFTFDDVIAYIQSL